jgi:hypothetical protein
MLSRVVCAGTELMMSDIFQGKAVAEKDIAFFTLVVRVDKFCVFHLLEFLDFRLDDGVGSVRVH